MTYSKKKENVEVKKPVTKFIRRSSSPIMIPNKKNKIYCGDKVLNDVDYSYGCYKLIGEREYDLSMKNHLDWVLCDICREKILE